MDSHGFLANALVFLLAAVICVPISKKLGFGSVLGYLIAGIAIGPWALGLITDVEDILHFSEFGVVLLLFLIGLELEPKKLWALRVPIFGMGSAQVFFVTIAITGIGLACNLTFAAALLAGMGLSLSSTAIALQILKEKKILNTTAGQSSFSILLFQDIAVIPMIAILPLLTVAQPIAGGNSAIIATGKVVAILVAIILVGRLILRPVLRLVASVDTREIFSAFALLLVIGMAYLMNSLNISMGLGAFMAGVLLADSEYKHALETDIEPFKGLLLGLFFISVGMSIDIQAILASPRLIIGIVAGIFVVKSVIHGLIAAVFNVSRTQRGFFSLILSQVGEFAFVLFGAAKSFEIISPQVNSVLMAAAAVSMLLTPLIMMLFDFITNKIDSKRPKREHDTIEDDHSQVIIAGFGRFGQIIGRLLYANKIATTVLDHEPDQIEMLRKFGFKVYYGDATRMDLLEAAGAKSARIIVVAIDDVEDNLKLIDAVKLTFPHLKIMARARNVRHFYELLDRGVACIERETFESSLRLGSQVLQELGMPAHQALRAAHKFRSHNNEMIRNMHPLSKNQEQLVSKAKEARADLERMFTEETNLLQQTDSGWDSNHNLATPRAET